MSQIEAATHESDVWLYYHPEDRERWDGLAPYWALTQLLVYAYDGHAALRHERDGERLDIDLAYSKSAFAPRPEDEVDVDRLYELEVHVEGRGERKVHYNISPRFPEMRHHDDGERLSFPFHHLDGDEGMTVQCQGSNVDLGELPALLEDVVDVLFQEADRSVHNRYFKAVQGGRIAEVERYVRTLRDESRKLTRQDGMLHRLSMLLSQTEGTKGKHTWDNTECVGYHRQVRLERGDPSELILGHDVGRQIKSYLPEHPQAFDEEDSLYHPKLGVLFRKSLNKNQAVPWEQRDELIRQLDETIINLLAWADIPTEGGGPPFVSDDHFSATASRDEQLPIEPDPTPELEAQQDHLLVTALRDMTDADVEIVETLATDGGQLHVDDVADETGYGISTVYRCLQRVEGVLESDDGLVRFMSEKIAEDIRAIVESAEHHIETAADRVAELYNVDVRQSASSAVSKLLARYGGEYVPPSGEDGRHRIRLDTLLSELKSTSTPYVQDVVDELWSAWVQDGRADLVAPGDLWLEYETPDGSTMKRLAALR